VKGSIGDLTFGNKTGADDQDQGNASGKSGNAEGTAGQTQIIKGINNFQAVRQHIMSNFPNQNFADIRKKEQVVKRAKDLGLEFPDWDYFALANPDNE